MRFTPTTLTILIILKTAFCALSNVVDDLNDVMKTPMLERAAGMNGSVPLTPVQAAANATAANAGMF